MQENVALGFEMSESSPLHSTNGRHAAVIILRTAQG